MFKPPGLFQLKTYFLETRIFYVYSFMALLLTVYRCVDKSTICKCLAIVSLLHGISHHLLYSNSLHI